MKVSNLSSAQAQTGFTLIELMIALILGLIVVAAAGGLFLANKRTYAATEVMSRIGESSRVSFELMARDIREAGGIPCGRSLPVANVLKSVSAGSAFDFGSGIIGYDNSDPPSWATGAPPRAAGTDVLDMHSGSDSGVSVESHNAPSAQFKVTKKGVLKDGEIAMVCDYEQVSIFQITSASSSNFTIVHNTGSESPGNCTKALGYPVVCSAQCTGSKKSELDPSCKEYGKNSMMVKMRASRWYLGTNARGKSLYRVTLTGGLAANAQVDEIVSGVDDLQFTYLVDGSSTYVTASAVAAADWAKVKAVNVSMRMRGTDTAATGNTPVDRNVRFSVNLRNRVD